MMPVKNAIPPNAIRAPALTQFRKDANSYSSFKSAWLKYLLFVVLVSSFIQISWTNGMESKLWPRLEVVISIGS